MSTQGDVEQLSTSAPHLSIVVLPFANIGGDPEQEYFVDDVSKVRDSAYTSGRGNNWVKKTCAQRETLTIAGFALEGNDWDGIYVGRRKGNDLIYAGKVDHGFDKKSAADLRKRLTPLIRKTQPYSKRIAHKGIWVEPELMAEIEYRAKSAEGKVRHPFFKGVREDI